MGYSGAGEVILDGEVIHGFSCPSLAKIVEVRPSSLLLWWLHRTVAMLTVCVCVLGWLCV